MQRNLKTLRAFLSKKVNNKEKLKIETTDKAFEFMVLLAQTFAMMPVLGVTGPDFKSLKFSWTSWKMFYNFLYLILLFVNIDFLILYIYNNKVTFGRIGNKPSSKIQIQNFVVAVTILFFLSSFITTVLFLTLAQNWPNLMEKWTEIDKSMRKSYGFPKRLHFQLKLLAAIIMTAAACKWLFRKK